MTPAPRKAGRPKAAPTAVIRLRVPVDAHAAIVELGGDKWARRVILEALRAQAGKAPWLDFQGQEICADDEIQHPDGNRGKVVFVASEKTPSDQWRVDYGDKPFSRLCLQVGSKGQAVVVRKIGYP